VDIQRTSKNGLAAIPIQDQISSPIMPKVNLSSAIQQACQLEPDPALRSSNLWMRKTPPMGTRYVPIKKGKIIFYFCFPRRNQLHCLPLF